MLISVNSIGNVSWPVISGSWQVISVSWQDISVSWPVISVSSPIMSVSSPVTASVHQLQRQLTSYSVSWPFISVNWPILSEMVMLCFCKHDSCAVFWMNIDRRITKKNPKTHTPRTKNMWKPWETVSRCLWFSKELLAF